MPGGQIVVTTVRNGGWCVASSAPSGAAERVGDLGQHRREVASVLADLARARGDHAQPGYILHAHLGREVDAVAREHTPAVAARAVAPVVVARDDHQRDGKRGEDRPQHLIVLVEVLVGEVALHDDQLRAPRQRLAQRGLRAHHRIRVGRIAPLGSRLDSGPPTEPSLSDVDVTDRRDWAQLAPRWR